MAYTLGQVPFSDVWNAGLEAQKKAEKERANAMAMGPVPESSTEPFPSTLLFGLAGAAVLFFVLKKK